MELWGYAGWARFGAGCGVQHGFVFPVAFLFEWGRKQKKKVIIIKSNKNIFVAFLASRLLVIYNILCVDCCADRYRSLETFFCSRIAGLLAFLW